MKTDDPQEDDDVVLSRLQEEWLNKVVRQREAPPGYECNIGNVFLVGEVALVASNNLPMVRQAGGLWIPLDHCERVGLVEFRGDPDEGSTIVLSSRGRPVSRVELYRKHQTVGDLLFQFRKAAAWLAESDDLKRDVDVRLEAG